LGLLRRPLSLGSNQVFEFTAVEEDPTALSALVDMDAIPFVRAHLGLAFGARNRHITMLHWDRAVRN
jgi:pantothenate synthetase